MVSKFICTWPATRSTIAWPLPLYGTWMIFVAVSVMNISSARCWVLPVPEDAQVSSPARVFANATSSFTFFVGSDGCTVSTLGT